MKTVVNQENQRGFTLVEVIVVAIIVAALAGVAIPMYNNYVKTSHSNAAANAAGSVASWMGQCLSQNGQAYNITTGQTPGTDPIVIKCGVTKGTAVDTISTMALPPKIKFTVSNLSGSGTVKAIHQEGGDEATYAY